MKLTVKDFLYDEIEKCKINDISFKMLRTDCIEFSSGSFCGDSRELCSVIDRDDWLEILVHETCHMDQFVEKDPLWFDPFIEFDIFNPELLKYADSDMVLNSFIAWTNLEIDADVRALGKIKKYNLDIDKQIYIQKSNCYHQSYYYFHKYNIFYDLDNVPYNDDDLVSTFNNKEMLNIDDIWCENPHLEKFLVRYNSLL